jgi:hypothetical protein
VAAQTAGAREQGRENSMNEGHQDWFKIGKMREPHLLAADEDDVTVWQHHAVKNAARARHLLDHPLAVKDVPVSV